MKYIVKSKTEPPTLKKYRLTPNATYSGYQKNLDNPLHRGQGSKGTAKISDLKDSLLKEQGYICCYCMQGITETNMKVEHFKSQTTYPHLQLSYGNMLAACKGIGLKDSQHCDTSKGNQEISLDPTNFTKNCERILKYLSNGRIYANDSIIDNNPVIDNDLCKILKLNLQSLCDERRAILKALQKGLEIKSPNNSASKSATIRLLKQKLKEWSSKDSQGRYRAYCQVAVFYLQKRIDRLQQ